MRADAQRNYDRLLHEAQQAFLVHGTDVPLEDIARHSGVGIGTLYRHFPNRYALVNAVFELELDALAVRAEELASWPDPAEALTKWLYAAAVHSVRYRGLAAQIMEAEPTRMSACKEVLRTAGGRLLERAQREGAVRADTQIGDLLKLIFAIVHTAERNPQEHGLFDRLMSLTLDGIRAREDGPAAAPAAKA